MGRVWVAVGLVGALLLLVPSESRAETRYLSFGVGIGFPEILHSDLSVAPIPYLSVDGRGWLGGRAGASVGATVHIPVTDSLRAQLSASYGFAEDVQLVTAFGGSESYTIYRGAVGVRRVRARWEWRLDLGVERWVNDDTEEREIVPSLTVTWMMNLDPAFK